MRILTSVFLTILLLAGRSAEAQTAQNGTEQSRLAPGDWLRVEVWREKDLSGDFIVNEQGIVTLPLLGRVDVSSIPLGELRDRLIPQYAAQLRNPSVTITPVRRVYVMGEVVKPGLYPVDPTITLGGAIALAGGPNSTGDLHRVRVIREGKVLFERIDASSAQGLGSIRSNDEIIVGRRSWFSLNSGLLATAAISAASIVISILVR